MIAAVNRTRPTGAERANNDLGTLLPDLLRRLDRAAAAHQRKAAQSHDESRKGERVMVGVTAFAFALGLLLVLAFATVVRYREQLEAARAAEVARLRSRRLHRQPDRPAEPPRVPGGPRAAAGRRDPHVSLALIDLDGLKQANDLHGHQVGDECLIALAAAISMAAGRRRRRVPRRRRRVRTAARRLRRRRGAERGATAAGDARPHAVGPGGRRDRRRRPGRAGCDRTGPDAPRRPRADPGQADEPRRDRCYTPDLEPILQSPDEAEESRHRATLATALARAVDAKDAYTHSHCETVAELCAMIGHELGPGSRRIWPAAARRPAARRRQDRHHRLASSTSRAR